MMGKEEVIGSMRGTVHTARVTRKGGLGEMQMSKLHTLKAS